MNQDDILQNTRSVVQSLEALKNEHTTMIKTLCDKLETIKSDLNSRTIVQEEISILKNSDEMVHLGISEATVSFYVVDVNEILFLYTVYL